MERETLFALLFEFDVVLRSSRLAEAQFVCFIICPSILKHVQRLEEHALSVKKQKLMSLGRTDILHLRYLLWI